MHDKKLRLDGVYRTSSPIILDSDYGETISLSLRFRRNCTVDYESRLNEELDFEEKSGTTSFKVFGESMVRFSFDVGCWETEWEGDPCDEKLRLTFRVERYGGGPAAPLKCVVESETTLLYTPDRE